MVSPTNDQPSHTVFGTIGRHDLDEDVELAAAELALHVVDPDHPGVRAPREHPRLVRQLFPDEARDREGRDDKEHDPEYLLELQHYAFPEEHSR